MSTKTSNQPDGSPCTYMGSFFCNLCLFPSLRKPSSMYYAYFITCMPCRSRWIGSTTWAPLSYFHLSLSTLTRPEDGNTVQSTVAAQNSGWSGSNIHVAANLYILPPGRSLSLSLSLSSATANQIDAFERPVFAAKFKSYLQGRNSIWGQEIYIGGSFFLQNILNCLD